jgi:hypothetical protein
MKLAKREIAWQREGQIAAAINYRLELPPGHNAFIIKVQNEWRVLYLENGVTSEWEDRYVSADAALEDLEQQISRIDLFGDVPDAAVRPSSARGPRCDARYAAWELL